MLYDIYYPQTYWQSITIGVQAREHTILAARRPRYEILAMLTVVLLMRIR